MQSIDDHVFQSWMSDINASSNGTMYKEFTTELKLEPYFHILPRNRWINLLLFRTFNHHPLLGLDAGTVPNPQKGNSFNVISIEWTMNIMLSVSHCTHSKKTHFIVHISVINCVINSRKASVLRKLKKTRHYGIPFPHASRGQVHRVA